MDWAWSLGEEEEENEKERAEKWGWGKIESHTKGERRENGDVHERDIGVYSPNHSFLQFASVSLPIIWLKSHDTAMGKIEIWGKNENWGKTKVVDFKMIESLH